MKQRYTERGRSFRWCFTVDAGTLVVVNRRDTLLAALVVTVWGFNFVVIQWGMDGVPPLLFAAIRFTVVLVPALFVVPKPDAPWRTILGVGTFMSLGQFAFLYSSMHAGMPPGLAALVLQAQVILTIVLASAVLRERPTPWQVVGVLIGSAGLVVVAVGRGGHVTLGALLLCLLAGVSWAVGNVISRSSGIRGGLSLTVWSALVVPVPLFVLSLLLDGPHAVGEALTGFGARQVASTAYTAGLASLFGYAVFNGLLSRYPSSAVVPWALWGPVVAMTAGWVLLDQRPNTAEITGGVMLLLGVLVALELFRTPLRRAVDQSEDLSEDQSAVRAARRVSTPAATNAPAIAIHQAGSEPVAGS
jgi:O-acetylserine/cysteine efflux transporter